MNNTENTVTVDCKVQAPEGFIPKNSAQDIDVMRRLFNEFDQWDYEFNGYSKESVIKIQQNRDFNTAYFYEYYRVEVNQESSTLAKWRYQNEEVYKRFMFLQFVKERT